MELQKYHIHYPEERSLLPVDSKTGKGFFNSHLHTEIPLRVNKLSWQGNSVISDFRE
jgi:hypothetical protein